jgi:hypothetical protein
MPEKNKRKPQKKKPQKKGRGRVGRRPADFDPRAAELSIFRLNRVIEEMKFHTADELTSFLSAADYQTAIDSAPAPRTPLEAAQEKMYAAFHAAGKQRVELAREALSISEDCGDAYVLLAEETARTPEEALDLYERGMQAAERALGPAEFERCTGRFWGVIETRPYMRAREGAAICLALTGRLDDAISHLEAMLVLNTTDNQGIRYKLLRLLLTIERDEEAKALLERYDISNTYWVYSKALVAFRLEGESPPANALLHEAFRANAYVPAYLGSLTKLPAEVAADFEPGEPDEAAAYVDESEDLWLDTPGALAWMVKVFIEAHSNADGKDFDRLGGIGGRNLIN